MFPRLFALLALTSLGLACSSSNEAGAPASTPEPPPSPPAGPAPIEWTSCDLHSEGGGTKAECATVAVPLRAGSTDGTLDVHVKRYHPKGGKSLRQLWMLQGGPGASAYAFESLSEVIATKFPDVDYYLPDHRGTGKSSRITCAAEGEATEDGIFISPAEWPACIEEVKTKLGDRLSAYSTTNAANDIGVLIERARVPGQDVFVYGVSYGTYWATRYLQLYPEQANGVILDSVVPPNGSLARQDEDANVAAKDLFGVCATDPTCSPKLGPDPWAKANALFAKLKTGHCSAIALPEIPLHVLFRRAFGQFLMSPDYRLMIPPLVYRLDRCAQKDIDVLKPLVVGMTKEQPVSEFMKQWGWVVSNNVAFSELWETPRPTAADLDAIREGAVASRDVTTQMDVPMTIWPTYPADAWVGKTPATSKPVLVLQGGLDPATLLVKARALKDTFNRPGQHWIEVPSATHTVIGSSATTEKRSCGTMMMMSFMEKPMAPDTSCLANVIPVTFNPPASLVQQFFGQDDAWE